MARRRSKYGLSLGLGETVATNFLAYASNPDGTRYVQKLREFANDPKKRERYKKNVRAYFNALFIYLSEHPNAIKNALDPVYSEVKRLAGLTPTPPEKKPPIEVTALA